MIRSLVTGLVALALLGCSLATARQPYTSTRLLLSVASHTDDKAYPFLDPIDGASHEGALGLLLVVTAKHHIPVSLVSDLLSKDELWGLYVQVPAPHIYLEASLSANGRVAVLAHELAHALTPDLRPPDDDVVAQAVSYVVCGELGLDTEENTLSYYFYTTRGLRSTQTALMRHAATIDRVAHTILDEARQ